MSGVNFRYDPWDSHKGRVKKTANSWLAHLQEQSQKQLRDAFLLQSTFVSKVVNALLLTIAPRFTVPLFDSSLILLYLFYVMFLYISPF